MGDWHIDSRCEQALIGLNDALCAFARNTGKEYTLILVPHSADEKIHMSHNGKPVPADLHIMPEELLELAMDKRE